MRSEIEFDVFKLLKPPKIQSVSEWVQENRYLTRSDSAIPGRVSLTNNGYEFHIGMLDAIHRYDEIVIMASAQCGKTSLLLHWVLYYLSQDPCPVLFVCPSVDNATTISRDRFDSAMETPAFEGQLSKSRNHLLSNTIAYKTLRNGGRIHFVPATSAVQLRSRPIKIAVADEISAYPVSAGGPSGEGDPIELVRARLKTYRDMGAKLILASTPKRSGECRIERAFDDSSKSYYMVPCLACGHKQRLVFSGLIFQDDDPTTPVFYQCEKCQHLHPEGDKIVMIRQGEWVATHPNQKVAGFHINELMSPSLPWRSVVDQYLQAKKQDHPSFWQVFTNSVLGEPYNDHATRESDINELMSRREDYSLNTVPEGVIWITLAIDVQGDGLFWEFVGWNHRKESWGLDYGFTSTGNAESDLYPALDSLIKRTFRYPTGVVAQPDLTLIDSGYSTHKIYGYCRGRKHVIPVKGFRNLPMLISTGRKIDIALAKQKVVNSASVRYYPVGVHVGKCLVSDELKIMARVENGEIYYPPGYCHYPMKYETDYFEQLLSEKLEERRSKSGHHRLDWVQITDENHFWDVRIYSRAGASLLGIDRLQNFDAARAKKGYPPLPSDNNETTEDLSSEETSSVSNG